MMAKFIAGLIIPRMTAKSPHTTTRQIDYSPSKGIPLIFSYDCKVNCCIDNYNNLNQRLWQICPRTAPFVGFPPDGPQVHASQLVAKKLNQSLFVFLFDNTSWCQVLLDWYLVILSSE